MINLLKIFIFFIFALNAYSNSLTKEEQEYLKNKKVLNTHIEPSWYPYSFFIDGKPNGYVYDLQKLIANKLGLKLNVKKSTFEKSFDLLKNQEIDLIVEGENVFLSNEDFIFSEFNTIHYVDTLVGKTKVTSKKDLENKKIAILSGTLEYYQSYFPKVEFISIDNDNDIINALLAGNVDFAISEYQSIRYYLNNLLNKDYYLVPLEIFEKNLSYDMQISVKKENQILMDILNKTITLKDIQELKDKWSIKIRNNSLNLTKDEEDYLIKNYPIKVGYPTSFEPILFKASNGDILGIQKDFYDLLNEKFGFEYELKIDDWQTILKNLKNKKIDIIPSMSVKTAQNLGFLNSTPFSKTSFEVFVKNDSNLKIKSLDDLKGLKVAINENILILKKQLSKFKDKFELIYKNDATEAFLDLNNNKVDAVISFNRDIYLIKKYEFTKIKSVYKIDEFSLETITAIKPDDVILQSIMNKMINAIPIDEKNAIIQKWLGSEHYFDESRNKLTQDEIEYLKNNRFSLCFQHNVSFANRIENGEFKGYVGDVFKEIKRKTDINFDIIQPNSYEDLNEKVKNNKCDIVSIIVKNQERFPNINPSETILQTYMLAISSMNSSSHEIDDKHLNNEIFIAPFLPYLENFKKLYPQANVILEPNEEKQLKLIQENKNFHLLIPMNLVKEFLNKHGKDKFKITHRFDDYKFDLSIGVNENRPKLLTILNKTRNDFDKGFLSSIASKNISFEYVQKVDNNRHYIVFIVILLALVASLLVRYIYIKRELRQKELAQQEKERQLLEDYRIIEKQTKSYMFKYVPKTKEIVYTQGLKDVYELDDNEVPTKDLIMSSMDEESRKKISKIEKEEIISSVQFKITTKNGNEKYLQESTAISKTKNGDTLFIVYGSDVSDKVKKANEIETQKALLLQQSRLAQLGEMISMIAHQWRQPLNAISLWQGTLLSHIETNYNSKDEKIEKMNSKIVQSITFMTETIDNFRNFYKPTKEKNRFDFSMAIRNAYDLILATLNSQNIKVDLNLEDNLEITSYEGELKQVFLVLVNNAIDTMKNKSEKKLIITTKKVEHGLVLEVHDFGNGIPEHIQHRVFEPYFTTKHSSTGTGLGLYMSKIITEKSFNGKIDFETSQNGTTFRLFLPN